MYVCIELHKCVYMKCMYVCMFVCMYVCMHGYMRACTGTCIRFYSLASTEVVTRPSFPSRPLHTETISTPQRDIPGQLATYSTQALSTSLLMLGTHFVE